MLTVSRCSMWFVFASGLAVITCYPTGTPTQDQGRDPRDAKQYTSGASFGNTPEPTLESDLRDEKQFPNGTVVGKYTYMDKEGNPIQVKYYADEASYGVELKSIKVIDPNIKQAELPETATTATLKDYNPLKALTPQIPDAKSLASDEPFNTFYQLPKVKSSDTFNYLGKEASKINRYKPEKSSPDFEVYYQNELKGGKKCGKEKVRVYFDKERKIRNAIDHFDADKYCEQF